MASLYDIKKEIMDCVDIETGEIIKIERLEELQIEKQVKIENIALWYKNLLSDSEQYKKEKDSFADKEKVAKNKAENLKKLLESFLAGEKFKTSKVAVSYRKSESVIIDDIEKIDSEFLKVKDPEADKTKIKKAIKDGTDIIGAHIEEKENIQIK